MTWQLKGYDSNDNEVLSVTSDQNSYSYQLDVDDDAFEVTLEDYRDVKERTVIDYPEGVVVDVELDEPEEVDAERRLEMLRDFENSRVEGGLVDNVSYIDTIEITKV